MVVAVLAAWTVRRVYVLFCHWHTDRGFATFMLIVCVAVLGTASVFDAKHQWVQTQASELVAHASGVPRLSRVLWNFGGGPMIIRRRSRSHLDSWC